MVAVKAGENLVMEMLPWSSVSNTFISLFPIRILVLVYILSMDIIPNHAALLNRRSANMSVDTSPVVGKYPGKNAAYKRSTDFSAIRCFRARTQVTPSISW